MHRNEDYPTAESCRAAQGHERNEDTNEEIVGSMSVKVRLWRKNNQDTIMCVHDNVATINSIQAGLRDGQARSKVCHLSKPSKRT